MRWLMAGCVVAATLGLVTAPLAGAETIGDMVNNTGALEMPSGGISTTTAMATSTLSE
jgi:hypothetical protein